MDIAPLDVATVSQSITAMQAARKSIAAIPALSPMLADLDLQIASAKAAITSSKPVLVQLRTCEQFIRRKLGRIQHIEAAIAALQSERISASRESAMARRQLKELQKPDDPVNPPWR